MNSVSWFIYIAQISNSLGGLFIFLGAIILVCLAVRFCVPRVYNTMEINKPGDSDYWPQQPFNRGWFAGAFVLLILGNLMPEKNTMYAIAASQVGEQIVKTDIASDATKALHQWIKKQIEPESKK